MVWQAAVTLRCFSFITACCYFGGFFVLKVNALITSIKSSRNAFKIHHNSYFVAKKDNRARCWGQVLDFVEKEEPCVDRKTPKREVLPQEFPTLSELIREHENTKNYWGGSHEHVEDATDRRTTTRATNGEFIASNKNHVSILEDSNSLEEFNRKSNGEPHKMQKPWMASVDVSRKTQSKIKAAAESMNELERKRDGVSPLARADTVLKVLLQTPPALCNEVNVLCSLTHSVKQLRAERTPRFLAGEKTRVETKTFESSLRRTCAIVKMLMEKGRLSFRQLANCAWSLTKAQQFLLRLQEQLKPQEYDMEKTLTVIEELMGDIAVQVVFALSPSLPLADGEMTADTSRCKLRPTPAELSMLCYAYAMHRPRECPTGWMFPPTEARLPFGASSSKNGSDQKDIITFERQDALAGKLPLSSQTEPMEIRRTFENSGQNGEALFRENMEKDPSGLLETLFDALAACLTEELVPERAVRAEITNGYSADDEITPATAGEGRVAIPHMLRKCSWAELANIAWSFAHRGHISGTSEALMRSLSEEAVRRMKTKQTDVPNINPASSDQKPIQHNFSRPKPWDISIIAWALGVQQVDNYRLGDDLEVFIESIAELELRGMSKEQGLSNWTAKDLVQLSLSLAHASFDHQELLLVIYRNAAKKIDTFQSWELVVLLWVQARLHLTEKLDNGEAFATFTTAAVECVATRVEQASEKRRRNDLDYTDDKDILDSIGLGPQEQANLAWSLTILEEYGAAATSLLQSVFLSSSSSRRIVKLEHAHQLWQALSLLRTDCPEAVQDVSPEFASWLEERWKEEKSRQKYSSARHQALSDTLKLMRVAHYNEHVEDIDVAIVLKESHAWTHVAEASDMMPSMGGIDRKKGFRVAVEFDGPGHFTRKGKRALGHTILKYRLLKSKGWTVVRVPYYEFDKIPFWASMERQRYLQRLLKTHANIRFSGIDVSEYKAIVPNRRSRFD